MFGLSEKDIKLSQGGGMHKFNHISQNKEIAKKINLVVKTSRDFRKTIYDSKQK